MWSTKCRSFAAPSKKCLWRGYVLLQMCGHLHKQTYVAGVVTWLPLAQFSAYAGKLSPSQFCVYFALWTGAGSCWKIHQELLNIVPFNGKTTSSNVLRSTFPFILTIFSQKWTFIKHSLQCTPSHTITCNGWWPCCKQMFGHALSFYLLKDPSIVKTFSSVNKI